MKTIDELKEMMNLSNKFREKVWTDCSEQAMEDQYDVIHYELNDLPGVRFHDHYISFYCRIADRRKFLEGMAEQCFDSEWQKTSESLLKKEDVLYIMSYDNKQWDNLDAWLDKKAEELLADVEKFLHSYEDISDDYVDDYLELAIENGWYDNATIKDGKVMVYHPAYWETL